MPYPQVIFLDAVGTLFGVKGSVGKVYSELASQAGVGVTADVLDRAFYKSFTSAKSMAFPGAVPTDIPHLEFLWWQAVANQTFNRAGVLSAFDDFEVFFENLYQHFTTAAPWFIYPDTLTSLERWRRHGIALGVISNFDSRLYAVLEALGMGTLFESVTISTEVGAAKPDAQIFRAALQKHGCQPGQAWHVGDSYQEDFQGARSAGLKAVWLKRPGSASLTKGTR